MSDDLTVGDVLDGLSLWDEHKPQSGEDWVAVAQRFIADGGDSSLSSPLFAGLVRAVEQANANEMRATMAEEVAGDTSRWVRLFNRLDAAISHHKAGERFPDDHDERLWAARDRILADAAKEGGGR